MVPTYSNLSNLEDLEAVLDHLGSDPYRQLRQGQQESLGCGEPESASVVAKSSSNCSRIYYMFFPCWFLKQEFLHSGNREIYIYIYICIFSRGRKAKWKSSEASEEHLVPGQGSLAERRFSAWFKAGELGGV